MAYEQYFSGLVVPSIGTNNGVGFAQYLTTDLLASAVAGAYPGLTCGQLLDQINQIVSLGGVLISGQTVVPPNNLNFIVPIPPMLDTVSLQTVNMQVNGSLVATYNWTWNSDGTKNSVAINIISPSTPIVSSTTLSCDADSNNKYDVFAPWSSYAACDSQGFLSAIVPACAVSTALPSIGGAVKCANFSKIFNPLGIPLRRK